MEKSKKIHLKRQIGLLSAVAILVGSIIASGIFISPRGVLLGTKSVGLCLIVWFVCGLISLSGSLCYAELGTFVKKSGSDYAYLLEVYGPYPAFLYCVALQFFVTPSSTAVVALTTAKYIGAPIFGTCETTEVFTKCTACLVLLSCGVTAAVSNKASLVGAKMFTFLKLIAAAIIMIAGFVVLGQGKDAGLSSGFSGSEDNPGDIASACYSALWAFGGWKGLNNITEELKNYKKNLPRAITITMLIVIFVYVSMNISYFIVLGPEGILNSDAVAVSFENEVFHTNYILSIGVAFSTTGYLLSTIFTFGRIPYVAAREGHLPEFLSFVHVTGVTPYMAIMFKTICSFILIFLGDVTSLINFLSILDFFFIFLNVIGLLIMRYTKKNVPRPYKVPIMFPILMVFVTLFLVLVPLIFTPQLEYLLAVGVIPLATLFYLPFIHFKKSLPFMDKLTMWTQLVVQVAPSTDNMDD